MAKLQCFRSALLAGTALVMPIAAAAQAPAPNAAPVLDRVVAGSITVHQHAGQTTVQQAQQRGIVDWRSFNVGRDHTVRFQQPGASAITLNRVTTADPSTIAGRITANGRVAIVNQSGVVFTQGAQVDAAGLIVSSANISNENFMAGRMVFDQPGRADARIENAGTITIREAGLAALVAPQVANRGTITARLGRIALAGAETHVVDLYGDGLLSIEVTGRVRQAPANGAALVTNAGVIEAQGGTVLLTAAAADGIVQDLVRAGGVISTDTDAATGRAGRVAINGTGGAVRVEGEVRASGTAAGTRGGQVEIMADRVLVDQGARVDASGAAGGGEVAIGTTLRGAANRRLAQRTGIAQGATVRADATVRGDGGTVIVNSQDYTAHAGAISARGGPQGGNGGFIEVSGQAGLLVLGTMDAGAPAGAPGTVLIDPVNLVIADTLFGGETEVTPGDIADGILGAGEVPGDAFITPALIGTVTGDLRLEASNDITVIDPVSKSGSLTLAAGRDITVDASINVGGALTLDAGRDLAVNAEIGSGGSQALFARTGNVTLSALVTGQGDGGSLLVDAAGAITVNATVQGFEGITMLARAGNVTVQNLGLIQDQSIVGIALSAAGGIIVGGIGVQAGTLLDMQAGAVGISQTAPIIAGTLQVRTTGNALLDLTPAELGGPVNQVGTLAASDVAGNFSLRVTELGEIAAPLVITDLVRVGGRFSLEPLTGVTQAAPSAIVTPDLVMDSRGPIDLLGDNAIAAISGITAGPFGGINIRNIADLAITGPITLTTPNFTAPIAITVVGGDLTVAAPITTVAQEGFGIVSLAASGNLTVTAAGSINADGPFGGFISLVAGADAFGNPDPSLPAALTLAGNVTAGGAGFVSLGAALGGIVQTTGAITSGSLAVESASDALLTSPANVVGSLASLQVTGTFELDNGANDLLVRTGAPSESVGIAGAIGLRTGGTVLLGEFSELTATGDSGRISFRVGNLIAEDGALATAALIEIAPFSATPVRLPLADPLPGVFSVTSDTLSRLSFQSLRLGATTFGGTLTTTATDIAIAAALAVPATLDLRSLGGITQDAAAGIVAATLTGASGGNTALTDAANAISTLGGFDAGGDFNLFSQGPLLTVPGGTFVNAGGTLAIEVAGGGLLVDGTVTGGTTSLVADRTLAVNGFSAIALSGPLLLQAPVVTLAGLARAAGDIVVRSGTSATLSGIAQTAGALSIISPSVTFGGLDARTADVRIDLGSAGFAAGALDAGGLLVQGGRGAVLTGTIAGVGGEPAAALGRRATADAVPLPDP
ncbi:beta strand repeat-containing protein, partial [Roseomonas rosulenta]|uniref:beta strand repeat-containing protein n=1 Tax=Roseomonas rosulenta TaxID=2748667 RepID=UPI0018DF49EB